MKKYVYKFLENTLMHFLYLFFMLFLVNFSAIAIPWEDVRSRYMNDVEYHQWTASTFPSGVIIPNREKNSDLKILIVGAGPGGLEAALKAYKKGAKVILIEGRTEFDREQIIQIHETILYTLFYEYFKDNEYTKFFKSIYGGDIYNVKFIKLKRLQMLYTYVLENIARNDPDNFKILFDHKFLGKNGADIGVDIQDNSTSTLQNIDPNWIVGADSAHSRVRQMADIDFGETDAKKYYFLTLSFANKIDLEKIEINKYFLMERFPLIISDAYSSQFVAVISEDLFAIYNRIDDEKGKRDFVIAYVKECLKKFGMDEEALSSLKVYDGLAHATISQYKHMKAIQAIKIINIGEKKALVTLIGDANRTISFFDTGMGAIKAIEQGDIIGLMVYKFLDGNWQEKLLEDFIADFKNYQQKIGLPNPLE